MKLISLSCLFALLLPLSASAGFSAASCKGLPNEIFSQVLLESGTTCATYEEIEKVARKIQAFAEFESPAILFVNTRAYESYANFGRLIVLNHQQLAWKRVRPQAQTEKVWAHELGHLIFNDLLAKSFAPIHPFRDYMAESVKLIVGAKNPELDTYATLKDQWGPDLDKVRDLQVPYNEFFADLVATLFAEDSLAMTKAMLSPGMPESKKKETRYYGFAGSYNLKNWNETEVHYFFAPARAFVGKHFLRWPMTSAQKKNVLQKVFQACLQEISKNWAQQKSLPRPSEANKALIEALENLR